MVKGKSAMEILENEKREDVIPPPPVFQDMEAEFLEYKKGESLTVKFPVKERYQNPLGAMQGGMILAAVDNTFGPLSYMIAPASLNTQMNSTFVKPVTKDEKYIYVTATVLEKTINHLYLEAKVKDSRGNILVLSTASFLVLQER